MKSEENSSVLREWAETTTAHGFEDFFSAKSLVAKVIWFFLIAISLTAMTYQLTRLATTYNQHAWSTTTEEIPNDSLLMPSLIVCNVNRLKQSKANQYNMTQDVMHYVLKHMDVEYQLSMVNLSTEAAFVKWRTSKNFSYMDIFDKIAPSFQDIFISSGIIDLDFVQQPIDTLDYGRCYCYDANKTSTVVGSKGGIVLVLDTQVWDYTPLFYNNYLYEGLALKMAYNCRAETGQWIILNPASRISISMQAYEKTVQLHERSAYNPFSYFDVEPPCEKIPQLRFSSRAQDWYTVENCLQECEWLRAVRQCNCIPYVRNEQYRTCEVDELQKCQGDNNTVDVDVVYNVTKSPEIIAEIESCRSTCNKPCYDKYVDVQMSMTSAPSQAQAASHLIDLIMYTTNKYVRLEDLIMLEIYFNSLAVQSLQLFEVMTLEDMVSNAGGLIGLWAGMSFLTVFQALDYFFFYVKIRAMKGLEPKIKPAPLSNSIYKVDKDEF